MCQDCLSASSASFAHRDELTCPHCKARLASVSVKSKRYSLWQHGAAILSLPLQKMTFLFGGLLALTGFLAVWLGVPVLVVMAVSAAFSLSYGAMLANALAHFKGQIFVLPSLRRLSRHLTKTSLLAFVGLMALASATSIILALQSSWLSLSVVLLLSFFALPVAMILPFNLTVKKDTALVNRLVRTIAHLESDYMAMSAMGALISGSLLVLLDLTSFYAAPGIYASLAVWLIWQAAVIWAGVIGYAAHEINKQQVSAPRLPNRSSTVRELDARLDLALLRGDYEEAVSLLESAYFRSQVPDFRLEQLFRLLLAQGNWTALQKYSYAIITLFLNRGRLNELTVFLKNLCRHNPDYRIRDVELCLDAVRCCVRCNEPRLLLWLVQDAHLRFPESPDAIVEMYRCAGKILHEEFSEHRKALAYLRFASKTAEAPQFEATGKYR